MDSNLLSHFDDIFKVAETAFTYQKMFDFLGISKLFKQMYINTKSLNKKHIDILHNSIKEFVKQPLFSDLNLKDEKDLKFLRSNLDFKDHINKVIEKIKTALEPKQKQVIQYLKNYPSKSEISLEEVSKAVKLDKNSLLIVMESLKEDDEIYDYNGREVTLK